MAKRVTLTNQGLSLLASSSEATGQYYWIGYYAMAYVPNLWKNDSVDLPVDECGKVNEGTIGSVSITETDTDQVTPTMTRLTKYGDMIYNIWQGDLNGTGFLQCASDGSPGGDLFGLTMYNTNIKKHYRYVLDSNGNNTLVAWIEDPAYSDGTMLGKHVYKGTDGYVSSTIPIPAPLYYLGDVTGRTSVDTFFNTLPTFEVTDGSIGNGASQYPYITVTLKAVGNPTLDIPRVSADYRGYTDSQGNPGTWNYGGSPSTPYTTPGTYFDTLEIPYPVDPLLGFDETSWFAADQTFNVSGATATDAVFGEEFWKLHTISNYNRFHAPVSSIGHVLDSDLSNRNMSKLTKFFPISNYKVINTDSGYNANSEVVEVATAIKLTIDIDITPRTLAQGFDDDCAFDETNNIQFFEKYNNPLNPSDALDEYGENIYNSTHSSFKFNRVGLYAVPLRKAPYVLQDNGFSTDPTGQNVELEFQIDPDGEPVLYAVIDWDNTISMSDTGDGLNQFRIEVDVNLQSPDGVNDTALVRDATIFYNLYEDDALHWYQNQLIANASTQNAITEIGLEVASIKNRGGRSECCPPPDLSGKFAPLDHTHDFLRNLKDANLKLENGLKGIITAAEGSTIGGEVYKVGFASVVLGENTSVAGNNSFIGNGIGNYITSEVTKSSILGGETNYIIGSSLEATILNGATNVINNSVGGFIGSGSSNSINGSNASSIITAGSSIIDNGIGSINNAVIIAGSTNTLINNINHSIIGAGNNNIIDGSSQAFIGAGASNYIYGGAVYTFIGAGASNQISGSGSAYASILSGNNNSISDSVYASIIAGQGNSIAFEAAFSIIGAGFENNIHRADFVGIFAGSSNYIGEHATRSVVGGGYNNYIYSALGTSTDAGIFAGYNNLIYNDFSFIGAGLENDIEGQFAFIGAGQSNYITVNGIFASINGGSKNVISSEYAGIANGYNNYIGRDSSGAFIGGGAHNYIGITDYAIVSEIDRNTAELIIGNSAYSSIIGGDSNTILTEVQYATILGGKNTFVTNTGEVAHSVGAIRNPTTDVIEAYNKHSINMLRGRTSTSDTVIALSLDDTGTDFIQMRGGEAFAGTLTVVGYMNSVMTPTSGVIDILYHEMHSVSGIYDTSQSTATVTELTYTEYDRSEIDFNIVTDPITFNAFNDFPTGTTLTATIGGHTVTITTPTPHSISGNTIDINVSADQIEFSGMYTATITSSTQLTYNIPDPATVETATGIYAVYGAIVARTIPHLPSIIDTVIDYRYTINPLAGGNFGLCNHDIFNPMQAGFPLITFGVDSTTKTLKLEIDATDLYSGSSQMLSSEAWWVATLDLTWIQKQ